MAKPGEPFGRRMSVELLAIDLETCGRCRGTAAHLEEAVAAVAGILGEAGVDVEVRTTVVRSEEEAGRLRLLSSPTLRVDGRDVALDFKESPCGDCGDLCGCGGGVACRVWTWRGKEYPEAPTGMIVDALLRAYGRDPATPEGAPVPFRLSENLRGFFRARAARREGPAQAAAPPAGTCGCGS